MNIEITTEYIKLQQLLKLGSIIGQGSDIKILLEQEKITINGIIATQRGKKIYKGDIVKIDGYEEITI